MLESVSAYARRGTLVDTSATLRSVPATSAYQHVLFSDIWHPCYPHRRRVASNMPVIGRHSASATSGASLRADGLPFSSRHKINQACRCDKGSEPALNTWRSMPLIDVCRAVALDAQMQARSAYASQALGRHCLKCKTHCK